jgi:hypothetical protein
MKNIKEFKKLDFHQRLSIAVNSIEASGYGHSNYMGNIGFCNEKEIVDKYDKIVCKTKCVNEFYEAIDVNFSKFSLYENSESFAKLIEDTICDSLIEKLIYNYNLIKNE